MVFLVVTSRSQINKSIQMLLSKARISCPWLVIYLQRVLYWIHEDIPAIIKGDCTENIVRAWSKKKWDINYWDRTWILNGGGLSQAIELKIWSTLTSLSLCKFPITTLDILICFVLVPWFSMRVNRLEEACSSLCYSSVLLTACHITNYPTS